MADWAVAQGGGEVAFYGVPELSFTPIMRSRRSTTRWRRVCPSCKVRHVDIPVGEIGKSAPTRVVSDLQSHPNTKVAVFGTAEAGTGLPAALKAAQLKVKLMGWGPPPAILGYIKQGQWDAALGVDALHDDLGPGRRAGADGVRRAADRRAEGGAAADPDPDARRTSPSTRRRAGRRTRTSRTALREAVGGRVMRLASFHAADGVRPAVVVGDDVVDLAAADRHAARALGRAARPGPGVPGADPRDRGVGPAHRLPLDGVRLAPPVQPRKFFAIGLNYADHVAESGLSRRPST